MIEVGLINDTLTIRYPNGQVVSFPTFHVQRIVTILRDLNAPAPAPTPWRADFQRAWDDKVREAGALRRAADEARQERAAKKAKQARAKREALNVPGLL